MFLCIVRTWPEVGECVSVSVYVYCEYQWESAGECVSLCLFMFMCIVSTWPEVDECVFI